MKVRYRLGAIVLMAFGACGDDYVAPVIVPDAGVTVDGPAMIPAVLVPPCETKRLKLLVASPGGVKLGQITSIEAQLTGGRGEGAPSVSWWLDRESSGSPRGQIAASSMCGQDMDACARFVCTAAGSPMGTVPDDGGASSNKLWIVAKYEDATCFDVVRIEVACTPDSGAAVDAGPPSDAGREGDASAVADTRADAAASDSQTDNGVDTARDTLIN